MKFPTFRRVYKVDYPQEQQSLIEKLSITINNSFETIFNAFNKNISLNDNIACTLRTVSIKVDTLGIPTSTTMFSLDNTTQIRGIEVIKAENITNSTTYPTSAPFISYSQNGTTVTINHITGLPANNTFSLSIIAWN